LEKRIGVGIGRSRRDEARVFRRRAEELTAATTTTTATTAARIVNERG